MYQVLGASYLDVIINSPASHYEVGVTHEVG